MFIKICSICGKEFETNKANKKYCSTECSKQGAKIRTSKRYGSSIYKKCLHCGTKFESGKNGAKYKYCSDDCFKEYRRVNNKFRMRHANGLPGKESDSDRRCTICGANISDKRYGSIYCSNSCKGKAYYAENSEHLTWEEWKEKVSKQSAETVLKKQIERAERRFKNYRISSCEVCGKAFSTFNKDQKTCSETCSRKRRNRLKGRDDRINENNNIDRDISLEALYKRDEGICYICGGSCDFDDHQRTDGHFICGPNYPSIDHIVPLARGGMHAWDNVKLAHHLCNAKKSDILPSELELDTEIEEAYALARKVSPRKKQVKQFNKDGKLINIYESTVEASKQTGIKVKGIQKCARGECPSYKGHLWSY